jgi:hypothetical protein
MNGADDEAVGRMVKAHQKDKEREVADAEALFEVEYKPSWYVQKEESLAFKDGTKHGYHQDWLDTSKPRDVQKDIDALRRHLEAFELGETVDKDSGAHPLAHVRARAAIIMDLLKDV